MADTESMFQRGPTLKDVAAATLQPATPEPTEEAAPDAVEEDQSEVTTPEELTDTDGGEIEEQDDTEGGEEPTEGGEEYGDFYQVTLDGETREVSVDDLIQSYQIRSVADKRMQEASEALKTATEEGRAEGMRQAQTQIQQEVQSLEEQRQRLGQIVSLVGENLFQPSVAKPDEALRQTDPIKYLTQSDAYREDQMRLEGMKGQLAQAMQQMDGQVEEQRAQMRQASQRELFRQRPELREKEAQAAFTGRVRAAQNAVGFSQAEVDAYPDHRGLIVLEMAGRYLEMVSGEKPASKVVKKKTKPLKPGSSRPGATTAQKQRRADRERARKTGDPKDVAKLLLQPAPRR